MEVTVVSGDRDLLQLSDAHIKISIPKTSRGTTEVHTYYPEDVKREYQVTPEQFIDVKALMGDTSDNIPGVPSIGEKTATNLILQFGSVNGVYEHLSEVKPPRAKKSLEEHRDLAELSYKLAKICIEAPVEFSPEDARIGDLYTKEAYEYMSRLEFKSLLARFGDHVKKEAAAALDFHAVTDLAGAEALFQKAMESERTGAVLLAEGPEISGAALCLDSQNAYLIRKEGFLTGEYLAGKMTELYRTGHVWTLGLKSQLPFLDLGYGDTVYDAAVAAYLLNPLKDTYDYDDLARDHLGLTAPSRADLLKKLTYAEAMDQEPEAFLSFAGFLGHCAYRSGGILMEKLEAEGMRDLYLEIELPLIYALYHMDVRL